MSMHKTVTCGAMWVVMRIDNDLEAERGVEDTEFMLLIEKVSSL
jgi:hypothetical protein